MIGLVLAAGAGRRLQPDTDNLPKTLLPVDGDRTILDVGIANLRSVGLEEIVVVTGFAAGRVDERKAELEERHDVKLDLVFNPKAEEWNNAYSLWIARDRFADGVLMVNGDTVHPASVEESVLAARGDADIVIALDDEKPLGEEEMKVHLTEDGLLDRINKKLDPTTSQGEYIGVTLIEPAAAEPLADALEAAVGQLLGRLLGAAEAAAGFGEREAGDEPQVDGLALVVGQLRERAGQRRAGQGSLRGCVRVPGQVHEDLGIDHERTRAPGTVRQAPVRHGVEERDDRATLPAQARQRAQRLQEDLRDEVLRIRVRGAAHPAVPVEIVVIAAEEELGVGALAFEARPLASALLPAAQRVGDGRREDAQERRRGEHFARTTRPRANAC